MIITMERKEELDMLCLTFRRDVLAMLHKAQTGHPGGSLSECEILTAIYFEEGRFDPATPDENDRLVLCKGHGAPMLYRILAEKGYFPKDDLKNFRQIDSHLQGHPCSLHTPGVDASTGPLGMGYAVALGMVLAGRLDNRERYVYAVLGDGEINEGVVWETCMNTSKYKADRLITILDWNKVQLDGTTDEIMPMGDIVGKFKAFGYNTIKVDGHDVAGLCEAIQQAKLTKGVPTVILADTIKGKGVSFMEGKNAWHGKAISDEQFKIAMSELGRANNG